MCIVDMARSAVNKLKKQAETQGVDWCLFYQLVAETSSSRGWADKPIIDGIAALNEAGFYDQSGILSFMDDNPDWQNTIQLKAGFVQLLRGLPKPVEPVLSFSFGISYENKKGTTSEKALQVEEKHMNVDFILSKIQSMFNTKLARLRITIDENELTDETLQQCMEEDLGRQHQISVENLQKGFSSFNNIEEALQLVGKEAKLVKDIEFFTEPHTLNEMGEEIDHAFKCIEVLEPIVSLTGACEATKRIFIDPILVAAARIVKDVEMDVEREIESPDANGPVDYIFKHDGRTVCVTEGKYEKQDSGVSQNLAQLTAIREMSKKRKFDEISEEDDDVPLYGIATTYIEWQFLVLSGETVRISKRYPCVGSEKDSVSKMISMVAAVLREEKMVAAQG